MRQALVYTVGELYSQTGALRGTDKIGRRVWVESFTMCPLGGRKRHSKILLQNNIQISFSGIAQTLRF
jgi:hypothetical protein